MYGILNVRLCTLHSVSYSLRKLDIVVASAANFALFASVVARYASSSLDILTLSSLDTVNSSFLCPSDCRHPFVMMYDVKQSYHALLELLVFFTLVFELVRPFITCSFFAIIEGKRSLTQATALS